MCYINEICSVSEVNKNDIVFQDIGNTELKSIFLRECEMSKEGGLLSLLTWKKALVKLTIAISDNNWDKRKTN